MDKASERKKDTKSCGDTDIGVHDYQAGGKREQLDSMWDYASKEVVGLDDDRRLTNDYCKKPEKGEGSKKEEAADLIDEIINSGPPLVNSSKPNRVL